MLHRWKRLTREKHHRLLYDLKHGLGQIGYFNEKNPIIENTGHLAYREVYARDAGQNASNTGRPVLYGTVVTLLY